MSLLALLTPHDALLCVGQAHVLDDGCDVVLPPPAVLHAAFVHPLGYSRRMLACEEEKEETWCGSRQARLEVASQRLASTKPVLASVIFYPLSTH